MDHPLPAPNQGNGKPGQDLTLSIHAQSVVKPRNDLFSNAVATVWRANEDRFRVERRGTNGVFAAVADGAGASGLFCGPWADALVNRLPLTPVVDLSGLDAWLAGFCLEFRSEYMAHALLEPAKHAKFVREGSCAALAACWLDDSVAEPSLHWLAYGDCPVLLFDRTGVRPKLAAAHPDRLEDFERDPHLLNWKDVPVAAGLCVGKITLPAQASIVLASDAIGQFLLLRYLASGGRTAMGAEFRRLSNGSGRLAAAARLHVAEPCRSDMLDELRNQLASEALFAAAMKRHCDQGLLANDDATVVMIDVDWRSVAIEGLEAEDAP